MGALLFVLIGGIATYQLAQLITTSDYFEWIRTKGLYYDQSDVWWVLLITTPVRATNCFFCFSHWAGFIMTLLYGSHTSFAEPWYLPVLAFAAIGLANLIDEISSWGPAHHTTLEPHELRRDETGVLPPEPPTFGEPTDKTEGDRLA